MLDNPDNSGVFRAALLQTTSSNEMAENIATVSQMIRDASTDGADFVMTPETVGLMERRTKLVFQKTNSEESDPGLAAFRDLAAELGVWLLIGSLAVRVSNDKLANRSFLIDDRGGVVARYDKVLFNPKRAVPVDFEGDNRLFVVPVEDVVAVFRRED